MDVEKARTFQEKAAKSVDAENSPHEEVDAVLDDIERDVTVAQTHARNLIFFERKGLDEEFVSDAFRELLVTKATNFQKTMITYRPSDI